MKEAINIADFKQTDPRNVMDYAGFRYILLFLLALLFLLNNPPLASVLLHGWHGSSQPTLGFPSYSQLKMFGDLIRDLLEATAFYTPSSSVFPEVSCISSLSLSCAELSHPY